MKGSFTPRPVFASAHHPAVSFRQWAGWQFAFLFLALFLAFPAPSFSASDDPPKKEEPPDVRELTIHGTIDPRLYAHVITVYVPTTPDNDRELCRNKTADWATAQRKVRLARTLAHVVPDAEGRYSVTQSIDYLGDKTCGYEFSGMDVVIRRAKDDGLYASIPLLDKKNRPFQTIQGHESGSVGWKPEGYVTPYTDKKHFQISSGSRVVCFTKYYTESKNTAFVCFPQYGNEINGTDEMKSATIELDIGIEEERCINIVTRGVKVPDQFRDYVKPLTWLERIRKGITTLFE